MEQAVAKPKTVKPFLDKYTENVTKVGIVKPSQPQRQVVVK